MTTTFSYETMRRLSVAGYPAAGQNLSQTEAWLSTAPVLTIPKFAEKQRVCFVGGAGTIRSYRPESGTWTYEVEMELGPEPDMGRVGSETTILLYEADLYEMAHSMSDF